MDRNTTYAAINTKTSAMLGKLLTVEDYKKILSLKNPSEIATYLKSNTAYKELFNGMDTSKMHRDEIEVVLKRCLVEYMDKLMHHFNGQYKEFFKCFYIKHEIVDLKRAARLIHIDKDFRTLKNNLVFAGKYKYIDMDKVVQAKDINQLIESLNGTIYYPFLKNLIDGNTKESLYRFEMSLDRAFFTILEEKAKKLPLEDKKIVEELFGSYIDMLNLRWIYRGKKYYDLSSEEVFNYSIMDGYAFKYKKLKDFCYAANEEEFIKKALETPYGFMFKGDSESDIYMERRMNRYLYFKYKSKKQRYSLNIAAVLVYLELIEFEIRDIISMIETVRYEMNYEDGKKYLIKAI